MSRQKLFIEVIIHSVRKFTLSKRQRFLISVILLSLGLFFSQYLLGKSGVYVALFLSLLSDILFTVSMQKDLDKPNIYIFILPFLYTLAFGLFFFLIPARFITRIVMTFLYGVGLYSLFLSLNIFTVASIRTIALLSGARLVSFVVTLVSYFFLVTIILTLHLSVIPTSFLILICSFLLVGQSLWTITLDNAIPKDFLWVFGLSLCLFEASLILWFWPTMPTVISLFMTGFFYTIVGMSHVWFDKRLFRGVIWEYIWVGVMTLFILLIFTYWKG